MVVALHDFMQVTKEGRNLLQIWTFWTQHTRSVGCSDAWTKDLLLHSTVVASLVTLAAA